MRQIARPIEPQNDVVGVINETRDDGIVTAWTVRVMRLRNAVTARDRLAEQRFPR